MALYSETPKDKKIEIATDFVTKAGDIDKYGNMAKIASSEFGAYYMTIKKWADKDEDVAELFQLAMFNRATAWMDKATAVINSIPEFWEQPNLDVRGDVRLLTRERTTAVNRARTQAEHYRYMGTCLMPELYGDYKAQIDKQNDKLKDMQRQLDDITKNR